MTRSSVALASVFLLLSLPRTSRAQIREPGNHPRYSVEFEPHLALGLTDPPGEGRGDGIGPGLRLGIALTHDGFLPKLNDSVALGVGVDWLFYDGDDQVRARCGRFVEAPNDTNVCVELGNRAGSSNYLFFPAVMQWNFWLHRRASVFAEPGLGLHFARFGEDSDLGASPVIGLGGRFHFIDAVALTLRLGYPTSSLGVSLLL
jgi:hypothetical protein